MKWILSKFKTFVHQITLLRKWRHPTEKAKIFANLVPNKGPISRMFFKKPSYNSTTKRQIAQLKSREKIWKDFSKENTEMDDKHINITGH